MILACNKIQKAFGERVLIKDGSFHIEDNEKAALIGLNGAGKSSILKMIMGEMPLDGGSIVVTKEKTIGYLSQHQEMNSDNTIYDEVASSKAYIMEMENKISVHEQNISRMIGTELEEELEKYHLLTEEFTRINGYAYRSEITGVLKGLGFTEEEFVLRVKNLSGGQKTRVSLGKLLLTNPDILLLDEPTNHLDMNSIAWLENYLLNYKGAVLIVSHDRYFLNKVVSKVIEVEAGTITMYLGNYSQFAEKKEVLRNMKIREYLKQQQEIKHQKEVITKLKSFNREKSIKRAESREKLLSKVEVIEKPIDQVNKISFHLEPNVQSGKDVLFAEHVSKAFDEKELFEDVNFLIQRGERVAVIGDNGTGKSTLLKMLNKMIPVSKGEFVLGTNVHIGYYDQEYAILNEGNTIFEEIHDAYPTLTHTKVRNALAAFLFTGDDVYKSISTLSGGEKGRVSLAKLMLSETNFLILDEPTNHLDITSKEILETVLSSYEGTILYVSHDRYFVNQTATRILELSNKKFIDYIGNYDYYLEKRDVLNPAYNTVGMQLSNGSKGAVSLSDEAKGADEVSGKLSWKASKELETAKRKIRTQIKRVEEEIEMLETRDMEIDEALTLEENYSDIAKCKVLSLEKDEIKSRLTELYERWEVLHAEEEELG